MNPGVGDLPWKACDGSGNVTSEPASWRLSRHCGYAGVHPSPQKETMISAAKTPQFCIHPLKAVALQQQSWNQHLGCCLGYLQNPRVLPLGGHASRKSILFWLEVLQRVSSDHQHCSPVLLGCAENAVFCRNLGMKQLWQGLYFHLDLSG